MLSTIRDAIVNALTDTKAFLQVDVWRGDLEGLLGAPKRTPAAFVALATGVFDPVKTMPPRASTFRMEWDVIVFFNAAGKPGDAAERGYDLIETVCGFTSGGGLTGLKTGGGILWPRDMELLAASAGVAAYRISYGISAEI